MITCPCCNARLDVDLPPDREQANNLVPETAQPAESGSLCSDWVAELGAVQTQLEDAWTALCKQDWGAATQNVFDVRASVTKLVESVRGHSATAGDERQPPRPVRQIGGQP